MVSSTPLDRLRNSRWRGSRRSRGINSRQHGSSHIRALLLKRGRESKRNGRSRVACQTDLAYVFVETAAGKARAGALSFPLELTKTVGKRPLVERLSQAMNGRFPGFAPNSYVSPQNRSKFGPIYQLLYDKKDQSSLPSSNV